MNFELFDFHCWVLIQILKASLRDKQVKEEVVEKVKFAGKVDEVVKTFKDGKMTAEELGHCIVKYYESRKYVQINKNV